MPMYSLGTTMRGMCDSAQAAHGLAFVQNSSLLRSHKVAHTSNQRNTLHGIVLRRRYYYARN